MHMRTRIMQALKDHLHSGKHGLRTVGNFGDLICEIRKVDKSGAIFWGICISPSYGDDFCDPTTDYPNMEDALDIFLEESKERHVVALDEGVDCTIYIFESDKRIHCTEDCAAVIDKASHTEHDIPLSLAFDLVAIGVVCSECYAYEDKVYGWRSLKYLCELWQKIKPLFSRTIS